MRVAILAQTLGTLHERPGLDALRTGALLAELDFAPKPLAQQDRGLTDEGVPNSERGIDGQLETLSPPHIGTTRAVHQSNGHARARSHRLHTAFHECARAERAGDRIARHIPSAEWRDAAARHDIQRPNATQLVDERFGEPVG